MNRFLFLLPAIPITSFELIPPKNQLLLVKDRPVFLQTPLINAPPDQVFDLMLDCSSDVTSLLLFEGEISCQRKLSAKAAVVNEYLLNFRVLYTGSSSQDKPDLWIKFLAKPKGTAGWKEQSVSLAVATEISAAQLVDRLFPEPNKKVAVLEISALWPRPELLATEVTTSADLNVQTAIIDRTLFVSFPHHVSWTNSTVMEIRLVDELSGVVSKLFTVKLDRPVPFYLVAIAAVLAVVTIVFCVVCVLVAKPVPIHFEESKVVTTTRESNKRKPSVSSSSDESQDSVSNRNARSYESFHDSFEVKKFEVGIAKSVICHAETNEEESPRLGVSSL